MAGKEDMERALVALFAEVPEAVARDVGAKVHAAVAEYDAEVERLTTKLGAYGTVLASLADAINTRCREVGTEEVGFSYREPHELRDAVNRIEYATNQKRAQQAEEVERLTLSYDTLHGQHQRDCAGADKDIADRDARIAELEADLAGTMEAGGFEHFSLDRARIQREADAARHHGETMKRERDEAREEVERLRAGRRGDKEARELMVRSIYAHLKREPRHGWDVIAEVGARIAELEAHNETGDVQIRPGWDGAGRKGALLAVVSADQDWGVVLWDGDEDPTTFKWRGLVRISAQLKGGA